MSRKQWVTKKLDKELAVRLCEEYGYDPFLSLILVSRGYDNGDKLESFFADYADLCDPFQITDMDKAVERINKALDNGEKMCVYGDFDADGVTATAVLKSFLQSQGGNVISYIPKRSDGYGLNKEAVSELAQQNVSLIITVDNGISALEEAELIYELGMELVVTDHHHVGEVLPRACAVVDPQRDSHLSFNEWAGVGVAFKLMCALYEGDYDDLLADYGDIVAIGTVADLVSLSGENRTIVREGLKVINADEKAYLSAFKSAAGFENKPMSATDVAFVLAPRINAAGRMGSAQDALEMLMCDDYDEALSLAQNLVELNNKRREIESQIIDDIKNQIDENPDLVKSDVIVVHGDGYHNGVIGIVASRMVETYGKPCIVIAFDEQGHGHASCRSVDGFSIYDALNYCSDELVKFGGHYMAAGFSIEKDKLDSFISKMHEYTSHNFDVMPHACLTIDCPISPAYLSIDLVNAIESLEPYGTGNTQPVFGVYGVKIASVTPIGNGNHIRIGFEKSNACYTAVMFGKSPDAFENEIGDKVDIAVRISKNFYAGRESVNIVAVDIKKSDLKQEEFFSQLSLWEKYDRGEKIKSHQLAQIIPTREECAVVYKFLFSKGVYVKSFDALYFALSSSGISYAKMMIALRAFSQLSLIELGKGISIVKGHAKVDLMSAQIFKELEGRVENEH